MPMPLERSFYDRDAVVVARELLGKRLIRRVRGTVCSGIIIEVEAYLGPADSASHAFKGETLRNRTMFGPPGHAYVYAIHARYCVNAVTESTGVPTAVLIRAVVPDAGILAMKRRRGGVGELDISRGPARLCEAMAVDRKLDGWDLTLGKRLWVTGSRALEIPEECVGVSPRIGVTSAKDEMLRFFVDGSRFVSGPRKYHSKPVA